MDWTLVGLFTVLPLTLLSRPVLAKEGSGVSIRWLGHAAFVIEGAGKRILTDPFGQEVPYPEIRVEPDIVTVSHEHFDHNNLSGVLGKPRVLRGLTQSGDFAQIRQTTDGISILAVPAFHDEAGGAKRGKTALFVIDVAGLRIVHMGDLGAMPSAEHFGKLGTVDVLLIPVGGYYTIDARTAGSIVERLRPKLVVPMHYKTEVIPEWPIASLDGFIQAMSSRKVKRVGSNSITVSRETLPEETEVWALSHR
ncbi:MAG: MBL fold metallo-hydrolase [Firmicutes bacterium]|nr:MBL fold metallo-hydrolase [Bacillota bacterium]